MRGLVEHLNTENQPVGGNGRPRSRDTAANRTSPGPKSQGLLFALERRRRPVKHCPPETTPDRRHLLSSSPRPQEAMAPRYALPRTIGRSIRRARVSPKCAGRRECDLPIRNAAGNPYRGVRAVQIGHAKREAQKSRDGQVRVSPLMARLSKPRRRGRLPVTTNPGNASPVCDRVKSHSVVATTVFPCF